MDVIYWLLTARIIHEFENLLKFPVWCMAVSISVKNNNNYWTRLSKIYIVICQWWADQYLPKLNAKSNNIDLQVRKVCFLKNVFGKGSNLPFSCKSDRKKEKSLVSLMHEQNIICSQKKMDNVVHFKQTIICRGLIICRSRGEVSANEKEEKFATNDNYFYFQFRPFINPLTL